MLQPRAVGSSATYEKLPTPTRTSPSGGARWYPNGPPGTGPIRPDNIDSTNHTSRVMSDCGPRCRPKHGTPASRAVPAWPGYSARHDKPGCCHVRLPPRGPCPATSTFALPHWPCAATSAWPPPRLAVSASADGRAVPGHLIGWGYDPNTQHLIRPIRAGPALECLASGRPGGIGHPATLGAPSLLDYHLRLLSSPSVVCCASR